MLTKEKYLKLSKGYHSPNKIYFISSIVHGGKHWMSFAYFIRQFKTIFNVPSVTTQYSKVSSCNLDRTSAHKGRHSMVFINTEGAYEWLSHSKALSTQQKKEAVELLNTVEGPEGLKFTGPFHTSSETMFLSELQDLLGILHIPILLQKNFPPYTVDAVIGNLIVEFDEQGHVDYDPDQELVRTTYLINLGYRLLRIHSDDSVGKALGKVMEKLKIKT